MGITDAATLVEHWNGKTWNVQPSPSPNTYFGSKLVRVAATSPTSAWAVGAWNNGSQSLTLVEHWNGKTWRVQQSPSPGGPSGSSGLHDVAATSPINAWAVRDSSNGNADRTLIEHRR